MQEIPKTSLNTRDFKLPSNTPTRGKDQVLSRAKPIEMPQIQNFTGNIYKIRSVPLLPSSSYISRTCPKKIVTDKERLYEENLNLKQMFNYVNDENLRMRTKIQLLEKTSESIKSQEPSSLNHKSFHLVDSLKSTIKDLRSEIRAKDKEIQDMKQYIRYTKMQELEADTLQYQSECFRLKEIIDELLKKQEILPDGVQAYEDMKKEVVYLRKKLKANESKLETKESFDSDEKKSKRLGDLEQLKSELALKNKRITQLEQENKDLLKKSSVIKSPTLKTSPGPSLSSKIQDFLSSNHITSSSWVKSITSNPSLSLPEFTKALKQDQISTSQAEIQDFWKKHSKNNQILSQVLISLYEGEETEKLSISQIFEVFKARATLSSIQDLQTFLESELPEPVITETDFYQLCSKPVFLLESSSNIQTFAKFILGKSESKAREEVFSSLKQGFSNWIPLKKSQIEGILNRFQTLIFDCYEELVSRLQEKTRFQSVIPIEDLVQEFRAHGIIDSASEETCARAVIFFVSGSVNRVAYLKVVQLMYEGNFDDGFLPGLKEESEKGDNEWSGEYYNGSARLGDSLPKDQDYDSEEGEGEWEGENEKSQESEKYENEVIGDEDEDEDEREGDQSSDGERKTSQGNGRFSEVIESKKGNALHGEINDIEEVQLSEGVRNRDRSERIGEPGSSTLRNGLGKSSSSSSGSGSSRSSSHSS